LTIQNNYKSDSEIFESLKAGNLEATKYLYRYRENIKVFILKNNGLDEDANDIFQEALIILIQKVNDPQFELTASFFTYLYGISRNLWLSELRRRKKYAAVIDTEEYIETNFEIPHNLEKDEEKDEALLAKEIMNQLGGLCQKLLTLFYFYKWSMKKIATELNYSSEQTARQQKYRCIILARKKYGELSTGYQ
jgi:RNA polymerase sigma factor (sigma-70 family)